MEEEILFKENRKFGKKKINTLGRGDSFSTNFLLTKQCIYIFVNIGWIQSHDPQLSTRQRISNGVNLAVGVPIRYPDKIMLYSLVLGSTEISLEERGQSDLVCTCEDARRACMPTFVFSVTGQVGFRDALRHLITCRRRECRSLKKKVYQGMEDKLRWLFDETVMLGCVHVQPYLYGVKKIIFGRHNFSAVAHHLAHCPKESCAQLRRAMLLDIRDIVSPNARTALASDTT